MNKDLWFAFLWSIGLSDHLGDVNEAVWCLGEILNLELPPDDIGIDKLVTWLEGKGWSSDSPSLWEMKRVLLPHKEA